MALNPLIINTALVKLTTLSYQEIKLLIAVVIGFIFVGWLLLYGLWEAFKNYYRDD